MLNKCLWGWRQAPWSEAARLRGSETRKTGDRQTDRHRDRERSRQLPSGPPAPSHSHAGPRPASPSVGEPSQQACRSPGTADNPLPGASVGAGENDCPQKPPRCPALSSAWPHIFLARTFRSHTHPLSPRAGPSSAPWDGALWPRAGCRHAHLVDRHGGPVELVHLGGHGRLHRALSRGWRGSRGGGHWGPEAVPTAQPAVQEAAERDWETEAGRGGGGSLIIHQPGMPERDLDLGRNRTPRGRLPVTRAGSCDLPFNYLPLRAVAGRHAWSSHSPRPPPPPGQGFTRPAGTPGSGGPLTSTCHGGCFPLNWAGAARRPPQAPRQTPWSLNTPRGHHCCQAPSLP